MPLWAWVLIPIAVLLVVTWVYDRRARARGRRLNVPTTMARGVREVEGNPAAHRAAMQPQRWFPGGW